MRDWLSLETGRRVVLTDGHFEEALAPPKCLWSRWSSVFLLGNPLSRGGARLARRADDDLGKINNRPPVCSVCTMT